MNKYIGIPEDATISIIYDNLKLLSFSDNYAQLTDTFKSGCWTLRELTTFLFKKVLGDDTILSNKKYQLFRDLSKIEYRIKNSGSSDIHLAYLISAFKL